MGMTITEKIIAAHSGVDSIRPGQFVYADVDVCLGNDITAPIAIEEFEKAGLKKVYDRTRVCLVPDHFTPNKDIKAAALAAQLRRFARQQGLTHYWEVGRVGVEHALLPEQGVVGPGDLIIGADSHTCTYGALGAFSTGVGSTDLAACMALGKTWLKVPESLKFVFKGALPKWVGGKDLILYTIGRIGVSGALYKAMEFCGSAIESLPMDDRFAMCNMAIEAGGKNGIIRPDAITEDYARGRTERPYKLYSSDDDAEYAEVHEYDCSRIEPQVSMPSLPENARNARDVGEVLIDQVVIGSCTNGRISDMRIAAGILKGRKVAPTVRCLVIPATQSVVKQMMDEGLTDIFLAAECAVSTPTCGPCLGGHMGILDKGEKALATTNRNFVGRMGHPESFVYLSSPAVAAASAVAGKIIHPDDL
ncbi:MAG TPA: 3-isopropylmalate dehydratase large subunit [Candidatus Brocadiia bacterium]|nr:3-isopropylmalate dehydratase large subunit [Candidatus Brocadiia bacterium]